MTTSVIRQSSATPPDVAELSAFYALPYVDDGGGGGGSNVVIVDQKARFRNGAVITCLPSRRKSTLWCRFESELRQTSFGAGSRPSEAITYSISNDEIFIKRSAVHVRICW